MRFAGLRRTGALALASCGQDERAPAVGLGDPAWTPGPERCDAQELDDLSRFRDCSRGSDIFGRWVVHDRGLPAYDYRLDQHRDPRARYPLSERGEDDESIDRRDHWAAFGNCCRARRLSH